MLQQNRGAVVVIAMAVRRPLAAALVSSVVVAAINVYALLAAGDGRIRDLRVLRLARRAADLIDWNLFAAAPSAFHAERDLTTFGGKALLFASAAMAAFVLLLLFAVPLRFAKSRLTTAAALAFLSIPAVAFAARVSPKMTAILAMVVLLIAYVLTDRFLLRAASVGVFVIISSLLIGLFARDTAKTERETAMPGAPNILLISIDSLRADHLGAYGYRRATSPNIDAIARGGTAFETVISPTSWTLPAHMTMLTSLPPEKHGVITDRFRLAHDIETVPQRLHRAGYDTAGFVSATYLDGLFGFNRGFDVYDDYTILRIAAEKSRTAVTSGLVADRAVDWLRHRKQTSPFFLFLHFYDVHYNYNPPARFARMFDSSYRGPVTGDINSLPRDVKQRDLAHLVALYDGEIAWVDANIGRVVAALDGMGVAKNTIIVITADHGEEFLDHGQCGHYKTLYDEVLRVPLIIRYPGHVAAGRRVEGQVRLMDIGPTVMALAGIRAPRTHDQTAARSLTCYVKPAPSARVPSFPAFGDLRGEIASLRTGDAKLIRNLRTHQEEFYDLSRDPGERHDVRVNSDKADELRAMLDRWRSSANGTTAGEIEIEDDEKESLRSLGYLH